MKIETGFAQWFLAASPKEREMANAIGDAILGDVFLQQGRKKRLIRTTSSLGLDNPNSEGIPMVDAPNRNDSNAIQEQDL